MSIYLKIPLLQQLTSLSLTSSLRSGGAKVSCFLHRRGVQLILAYSWARPAILVAVRVRVEGEYIYFFCFFTFIPVPLSSLSLSFISSITSSFSVLSISVRRHKMTHKGWCVMKLQHNQSKQLGPAFHQHQHVFMMMKQDEKSACFGWQSPFFWRKNVHILVNRLEN